MYLGSIGGVVTIILSLAGLGTFYNKQTIGEKYHFTLETIMDMENKINVLEETVGTLLDKIEIQEERMNNISQDKPMHMMKNSKNSIFLNYKKVTVFIFFEI